MSRGAPVFRWILSKRWTPSASSRTTRSDHFSPRTVSADAIEHARGEATSRSTDASVPETVDFSNPHMVGISNRLMHTRVLQPRHGPAVLVRPLRRGDVRTVMAVFERLGEASRRARFNGPKPCLRMSELRQLATIDSNHHALVAYVEGDPSPVAIARLVRDGKSAEIAFAVADEYQHRGIGSALAGELVADARAAGVLESTPPSAGGKPPAPPPPPRNPPGPGNTPRGP